MDQGTGGGEGMNPMGEKGVDIVNQEGLCQYGIVDQGTGRGKRVNHVGEKGVESNEQGE